ncbi:PKD-like domain-containing protein, partial [Flavobacterium sp. ST-87]
MKTILPNLKQNKKIRLGVILNPIFYLLLFSIISLSTSAQVSQSCWSSPGSSGEFTLNKIYLASDLAGTPLATSACSQLGNVNVYLAVSITNGTNSSRRGIFLAGNISSAGNTISYARCFDVILNNGTPTIAVDPTPFTWTCGEELTMTNPFVGWGSGSGSICQETCQGIPNSKCRTYGNTIIATPLVAKFNYTPNCPGGTSFGVINLNSTTTGGNNNYTYKWESSTDGSIWTQFSTIQSPTFSPGNNNPYYIKLTVTDGSTPQNVDSETVSNISAGICCTTPVIANKTASICCGSTFTVTPVNGGSEVVPSGTTYSWTAPSVTGITGTMAGTNATNISGTLTNSTNAPVNVVYTVTPKSGTCTGTPFTVTVTVNPLPTAIINGTNAVCKDGTPPTITFTGASGTAPYTFTYKINGGSDLTITTTSGNSATVAVPTSTAGSFVYSLVSVKDASTTTCSQAQTGSATITVNDPPTATISGVLTACLTTILTANTNATSPTYVWYKNNVVIPNETSSTLVVNSNGDYKVKITNSLTSCETTSAPSTVNVEDVTKPVKPILADVTGECTATATAPTTTDNCAGTITATTTDALTYTTQGTHVITWTFDDGNGNTQTATQNVIVKDVTKPVKPILADVTGECTATATAPTTTDNCAG